MPALLLWLLCDICFGISINVRLLGALASVYVYTPHLGRHVRDCSRKWGIFQFEIPLEYICSLVWNMFSVLRCVACCVPSSPPYFPLQILTCITRGGVDNVVLWLRCYCFLSASCCRFRVRCLPEFRICVGVADASWLRDIRCRFVLQVGRGRVVLLRSAVFEKRSALGFLRRRFRGCVYWCSDISV